MVVDEMAVEAKVMDEEDTNRIIRMVVVAMNRIMLVVIHHLRHIMEVL